MPRRPDDPRRIDRRSFFRFGLRRAAATISETVSGARETLAESMQGRTRGAGHTSRTAPAAPSYEARPPGAVAAERFRELCTRCGDCIEACPAWAIQKARDGSGYPVVAPNTQACAVCEDPLPCIASCDTGALVPVPRVSMRLGLAHVDYGRCVVPRGQSCELCVMYCPVAAQAIRMDEGGPVIVESGCTGCGMCAVLCPENAIAIGPARHATSSTGR